MRHKSNNKTRPLFTLSLEMTRLVNETRLLLVPCFNSDIYGKYIYHSQKLGQGNLNLFIWSCIEQIVSMGKYPGGGGGDEKNNPCTYSA